MTRNLLVIGATGKTGRYTTELLLQRGHRVRALVRRVDERSEGLAERGAEVVVGDVHDLDSLAQAAEGIDAAYFTYPIAPGLMDATANLAQAAEENGVRAIVNMSQISARREAASNAARQHWVAERLLDRSPVAVTHLRPTFFAEWLTTMWNGTGELRFPFADGRHAPIAARDQAKVIASILEDPAPHAGKIYPLYGAVELDHYGIAEAMTRALGHKVTYVPIELDEFTAILEKRGASQHLIGSAATTRSTSKPSSPRTAPSTTTTPPEHRSGRCRRTGRSPFFRPSRTDRPRCIPRRDSRRRRHSTPRPAYA